MYIHTQAYTYTPIHTHSYIHTYLYIYTHSWNYEFNYLLLDMDIHIHIHVYPYTGTHVYTHTYLHTHTHTHTHTLLKVKVVAQLCLALGDPMDCRPPGSSVHGILQERILEWVAMPSSRGSSLPRDWTRCPELQADSLLPEAPGKPYTDPYTHAQTHTCVGISSLFWDTPPGFLCLFQLYLSHLVFPLLHSPCGWVVFSFHDFKQHMNDTHMYIPAPAFPLNF